MIYTRDVLVPTDEAVDGTIEHVIAHLASIADADDNPDTYAEAVDVNIFDLDDGTVRVVGELDAEPDAPYLKDGYDPDAAEEAGL